jgi:hypothetical protein
LVYADRLSNWPVVHQWRHDATAREVIQAVMNNFVESGVPMRFRSDGGPLFDARVFQDALQRWRGNSTPHYPQSNGDAEAVVTPPPSAIHRCVSESARSRHEIMGPCWRNRGDWAIPLVSHKFRERQRFIAEQALSPLIGSIDTRGECGIDLS